MEDKRLKEKRGRPYNTYAMTSNQIFSRPALPQPISTYYFIVTLDVVIYGCIVNEQSGVV